MIFEIYVSQTIDDVQRMNEAVIEEVDNSASGTNMVNTSKSNEVLDDVFDEMVNIEEAAKVLYGLQNMDRMESPQPFSITIAPEINSEFLNYTNFVTEKNPDVSMVVDGVAYK